MKISKSFSMASLLLVVAFFSSSAMAQEDWIELFNGKDLNGWSYVHDVDFDVHDGNLRLIKGMGWLRSDQLYDDFIMEFECKALVENYDSGFFFRSSITGKPWPDAGFQVNLKTDAMAYLVRGYRAMLKTELETIPVGEWMKFHLESKGEEARLELNGKEIWEADFIEPEIGLIGIQAENRAFEFRNMRLQEIGYTNLLVGQGNDLKHLTVQAGEKDAWSLKDGVLTCKGKQGGWIRTKSDDYGDFILKLDFMVPKEGNSGVYIRTPKEGDGAYTGMEIQILDDDAKHWGELQAWQKTGSIYHEVAPSVRATKQAGDWQSMMIKAEKSQITIYVNGVQIVDADLDEYVKSSTDSKALKDRPRTGYIGFQNYDGNIQYRNVRVKRLK